MNARQLKAPARAIEREQATIGYERNGTARARDIVRTAAGRADEIDFRHQRAARMFDTKQNDARHHIVKVSRPERAGKPRLGFLIVADADQIDVAFAVDLAAGKEEHVDATLPGAVEQ